MSRWTHRPAVAAAGWRRTSSKPFYSLGAMGGGRLPWTVRAIAVLVVAEILVSGAVLVGRPSPARSAALVRSVPTQTTTTSRLPLPPPLPPPPPTSPPATARPAPPAPTLPADPVARLTARLDAVLGNVRSCLIVHAAGATAYGRAGDLALAPASTQKLLVAVAALDRLGPDFRFETTAVAPAPPASDGAVDALWLVGSGDPVLATPEYLGHLASQPRTAGTVGTPLSALVDQLAAAGVKTVRNGVHGDDSRYDGPRWLPGWKPIYRDEADISPLSALTVDGGLDRGDRTTCSALLAALEMGERPGFTALASGLAVAGRSGTLVNRFRGTPLAGHLAAKTGSIDCAVSMVGRLDLKRPLRFALIVNGPCDYNAAIAYEDRVAAL